MSAIYRPAFRFRLTAQDAVRVQSSLFAAEPRTEPPCDHPRTETQITLAGETEEICSVCMRTVRDCEAEL